MRSLNVTRVTKGWYKGVLQRGVAKGCYLIRPPGPWQKECVKFRKFDLHAVKPKDGGRDKDKDKDGKPVGEPGLLDNPVRRCRLNTSG